MTIRDTIYQVCKSVSRSPSVQPVRQLIWDLIKTTDEDRDTDRDRTHFGYLARQQEAQFLGYLLVDQHRSRIEQGPYPWPVPHLDHDERELLLGVHKHIQLLNQRCVEPLLNELAHYSNAVDPYSVFVYSEPSGVASGDLLDSSDADRLVSAFHSHPAIEAILTTASAIREGFNEEQFAALIDPFEMGLFKSGVSTSPRDILEIIMTQGANSPARIALRHIGAVVGIRDTLRNLNQLIYQAVLADKLSIFDEDSITDAKMRSHMAGQGIVIMAQPDERIGMLHTMDLVLLRVPLRETQLTQLGRIEILSLSDTAEFGLTTQLELREVDEHLNAFGGLLRTA